MGRGIFHPDFFYHPRTTVESAMIARVKIYKPTGVPADWVPSVGMDNDGYILVWEGPARVQPNKDWRARPKEVAGEFNAVHAVRVQIPVGRNELGGVKSGDRFSSYGVDPAFAKDYRVDVVDMPVIGTIRMEDKALTVRNALVSSNAWLINLLCDVGTK
jgi:hypothetical protein